jgi:hypothetical protein
MLILRGPNTANLSAKSTIPAVYALPFSFFRAEVKTNCILTLWRPPHPDLPGLTNVADKPRYFSVLCAGAYLAPFDTNSPPRAQHQCRLDCILRIERFWALANVLARLEALGTGCSSSKEQRRIEATGKTQIAVGKAPRTHVRYIL